MKIREIRVQIPRPSAQEKRSPGSALPKSRSGGLRAAATAIALLLASGLTAGAHEHLAAGARTSEVGAELFFVNAANFAAESGYVFPLALATNGTYAGFHRVEFSFVCQPATPDYGGPAPFHPVLGARIEAVFETIEGPAGGEYEFWEAAGEEEPATEIAWRMPVGGDSFQLGVPVSQSNGQPDADPYGHVHGRVYSATLPGLYRIGIRFVDTSG
ncbi:MAG: hypothetical protein KIT22_19440, partial [Verrucomicrobiae bacterium]|nr:hypothetical protein [Verrucomicrobiae bacterium]